MSSPGALLGTLWLRLRWGLPFLASFLPIVLLSFYALRTVSDTMRGSIEHTNIAAASTVSQIITQEFSRTVSLAHAVASVPGTVAAVSQHDTDAATKRLKAIVASYPYIDRAFIADPRGVVWSDYPPLPGAHGDDHSDAEWYRGVSRTWKPTIAGLSIRPMDSPYPIVAIALPVRDDVGAVIGIVVFEYHVRQFTRLLQGFTVGRSGILAVLDHTGAVAAHPNISPADGINRAYAGTDPVRDALRGSLITSEYVDPLRRERMIATFLPFSMGRNMWVVVAEQPVEEAFEVVRRVRTSLGLMGGVLTFLTLGMVVALARMSARNERLNRELQSANRQIKDFTSIVSHQLKAPVTAMRWTLETMLGGEYGPVPDAFREPLTVLQQTAVQNFALISDILNVSRIDRGVITVNCTPVRLRDIVEQAIRNYRHPIAEAHLTLTEEGLDQDIIVLADRDKMAEAVSNSISNALKHTKRGGITVRVWTDDRAGYVSVADTGEGIPPEIRKNLFTRDKILGSGASADRSAGLGLYIARNFMRLQKGDIRAESRQGTGSTFTYTIPLAPRT